jgi:DNA replication protein DnaC
MKLLNPAVPASAFKSEKEYDDWRRDVEDRKARTAAAEVAELRGIPTKRYEGVEARPWRGGLLYGPAGTGKTREAIARLLSTRGIFYEAAEFIEDARAIELDRATELQERRHREAFKTAHLVLDDLGARRPTQFAEDAVLRLVNHRWKERLETLVTSNLSPDEIVEAWCERIASRIEGFGKAAEISGRDRRPD